MNIFQVGFLPLLNLPRSIVNNIYSTTVKVNGYKRERYWILLGKVRYMGSQNSILLEKNETDITKIMSHRYKMAFCLSKALEKENISFNNL